MKNKTGKNTDKSQFAAADKAASTELFRGIIPAALSATETFGPMKRAEEDYLRLKKKNEEAEVAIVAKTVEFNKSHREVQNMVIDQMQRFVAGGRMPAMVMKKMAFHLKALAEKSKERTMNIWPMIDTAEAFREVFVPLQRAVKDISNKIEMRSEKDPLGGVMSVPEVTLQNGKMLVAVARKAGNAVPKTAIDALEKRLTDWEARTTGKASGKTIGEQNPAGSLKSLPANAGSDKKSKKKAAPGGGSRKAKVVKRKKAA